MQTNSSYFFNCFKCGKCCDAGPAIGAEEIFEYQDDFVISLRMSGQPMVYSEQSAQGFSRETFEAIIEHEKKLLPVLDSPISSERRIIHLGFQGLDFAYGHRKCKFVGDDGQCQLYDRRPFMCRSVPFDPALPADVQSFCLDRFKKYGCMSHDSSQGELVYEDGQIMGDYIWSFHSKLNAMEGDRAFYRAVMAMVNAPDDPFFGFIRRYAREFSGADWLELSPLPGLVALGMAHGGEPGYAGKILEFIDSQEHLIKEGLENAVRAKDKALRERTDTYRRFLVDYQSGRTLIEKIHEGLTARP